MQVRLPTSEENLVYLVNSVEADRKIVTVEELAPSHWAVEILKHHCDEAFSCDPKVNAWIFNDPNKKDESDSEKLGRLSRMGELKKIYHQDDPERYAFKIAVQHYHEMKDELVACKNKIKGHLLRAGIIESNGEKVFTKKNRQHYLSLVDEGPWRNKLNRLYRLHDWLVTEKEFAKKEYEKAGEKYPEIANFMTMFGVGSEGAHTFSALIQDPHRFASDSKLHRFCALSVTDKSSDGKSLGYERLERNGGHGLLKAVSYRIYLVGVAHDSEIKTYFEAALAENGGNRKRARLTTQRKILKTMWSMWKNQTSYDPAKFVHSYKKPKEYHLKPTQNSK